MALVKTNDLVDIYRRIKKLEEMLFDVTLRLAKIETNLEVKNNVQPSAKSKQWTESRNDSHEHGTQGKPSDG